MAKILITGAAGFIGYNLWEKLCIGHTVMGIDNLTDFSNPQMKLQRLSNFFSQQIQKEDSVEVTAEKGVFIAADILDRAKLQSLFSLHTFDVVIHLAALTGIRPSIQHEEHYRKVNEQGFKNVVEIAEQHGVKKIIYASSSSVYGSCSDYPFTEESDTNHPLNPYASTKKNNELFAEHFTQQHDITMIGLRFFTVYGPWTRPDMATFNFIRKVLNNEEITVFQHQQQSMVRDFTYVEDVCEAIARLVQQLCSAEQNSPSHTIYNIGGGEPVDVATYVAEIGKQTGRTVQVKKQPGGEGEMIKTFANCNKLFQHISFKPKVSIEEGLQKTIEWYNFAIKHDARK